MSSESLHAAVGGVDAGQDGVGQEPVISVRNLGKRYHIYQKPHHRLLQGVMRGHKMHREFWALRDVDLDVYPGETLGIIGRNGAGKSTLMQLICGTLQPTSGTVTIRGRIAALLELGAGFNPEFTGRENVFLKGSLLGMPRALIEERFDDILAFSEIGNYIDQPVKTYSSGMFVRLAFSVSVCAQPDILVVDEALAVGDVYFQRKCQQRIGELRERGCTLLFVTHSVDALARLCKRGIVLDKGAKVFDGQVRGAVSEYMRLIFGAHEGSATPQQAGKQLATTQPASLAQPAGIQIAVAQPSLGGGRSDAAQFGDPMPAGYGSIEQQPAAASTGSDSDAMSGAGCEVPRGAAWLARQTGDLMSTRPGYNRNEIRMGNGRAIVADFIMTAKPGSAPVVRGGESLKLLVRYQFRERAERLMFGFQVRSAKNIVVYSTNTFYQTGQLHVYDAGQNVVAALECECRLLPGQYYVTLGISQFDDRLEEIVALDRRMDAFVLTVIGDEGRHALGLVDMDLKMKLDDGAIDAADFPET